MFYTSVIKQHGILACNSSQRAPPAPDTGAAGSANFLLAVAVDDGVDDESEGME
jgi:hypothetical protein